MVDHVYKVITKLIITPMKTSDFGAYKCVAKNSIGQAEKFINLYRELSFVAVFLNGNSEWLPYKKFDCSTTN